MVPSNTTIGYFGMSDFWESLSPSQRAVLDPQGVFTMPGRYILFHEKSKTEFLTYLIMRVPMEHSFQFVDQLRRYTEEVIARDNPSPIELHNYYDAISLALFNQKSYGTFVADQARDYARRDLELLPKFRAALKRAQNDDLVRLGTLRRLIADAKERDDIDEWISLCKYGIKHKLRASQHGGYEYYLEQAEKEKRRRERQSRP